MVLVMIQNAVHAIRLLFDSLIQAQIVHATLLLLGFCFHFPFCLVLVPRECVDV